MEKYAEYRGYVFCRDDKSGYYLSTRKIEGSRKRLHRYVWECNHGEIPKGYDVHHKDYNKANNALENLKLLPSREHQREHGSLIRTDVERLRRAQEQLNKYARPKAVIWHKSEKGRQWHRIHGKQTWENRKPQTYECVYCGAAFQSIKICKPKENKFCSNKCKSAYRRKMGYDDEERICKGCGKPFRTNKYSKTQACSRKCGGLMRCLKREKLEA